MPLQHSPQFLKALIIPFFILVILDYLSIYIFSDNNVVSVILAVLNFIVYSYYALSCHRIVLLAEQYEGIVIPAPSWRLMSFMGWLFITSIIFLLIVSPFYLVYLFVFVDALDSERLFLDLSMLAIPAFLLLSRFSLVLPACAVDNKPTLGWSWRVSMKNSWRLFIVVGVLPMLFVAIIGLVSNEDSGLVADIIGSVLYLLLIIIEFSALSLSYKYLVLDKEISEQQAF